MISWLRNLLEQWRIYLAEIDPNSKCPSCGHRNGKLECVDVKTRNGVTKMVKHTCQVDHAIWYEPTILKPEKWVSAELLTHTQQPRTS